MKKFEYRGKEYKFKTKKEALKKLLEEYQLKETEYICFYIWSYRVCKNSKWEEFQRLVMEIVSIFFTQRGASAALGFGSAVELKHLQIWKTNLTEQEVSDLRKYLFLS